MALTETRLHAKRHDRVLASRSRIAHKARRDAQLRLEAGINARKNSSWLSDLADQQFKAGQSEREAAAKAIERDRAKAQAKTGWLAGAVAKVAALIRPRGR